MNIAVIPARAGSKRIPNKNLKNFLDKPIISYSINAALESKIFQRVIVSTDSNTIAEVAVGYGAEVPFLRSSKNSDDFATTMDVLKEVCVNLKNEDFENVCCIYPTAPFVTSKMLEMSYQKYIDGIYESLCPVTEYDFPTQRSLRITDQNKIYWTDESFRNKRSQDLEKFYHDVGQFYWLKKNLVYSSDSIISKNTGFFLIEKIRAQDIDTLEDWLVAESKFEFLKKRFGL